MWLTSMSARLTSTTMIEVGTVSRISFRSEVVISLAELFGVGRASYQLDPEDMSTVVEVPAEGVVVIILTLRERDEVSNTRTRTACLHLIQLTTCFDACVRRLNMASSPYVTSTI